MLRRGLIAAFLLLSCASAWGEGLVWHPERVSWQGVGCQFAEAPGRPQNAWIITAGDEMSVVYSGLGSEFRTRRNGTQVSQCNLAVPVELSAGFYIREVSQSFFYGMAKQVGVEASLIAQSNILRRTPNGATHPDDGRRALSEARLTFPLDQEINIALHEVKMPPLRIVPDADAAGIYTRLCRVQRQRELLFQSVMTIRVRRTDPKAEISIAIDGQDLKFSSLNSVAPCPALPVPPPQRPGPAPLPAPYPRPYNGSR